MQPLERKWRHGPCIHLIIGLPRIDDMLHEFEVKDTNNKILCNFDHSFELWDKLISHIKCDPVILCIKLGLNVSSFFLIYQNQSAAGNVIPHLRRLAPISCRKWAAK